MKVGRAKMVEFRALLAAIEATELPGRIDQHLKEIINLAAQLRKESKKEVI